MEPGGTSRALPASVRASSVWLSCLGLSVPFQGGQGQLFKGGEQALVVSQTPAWLVDMGCVWKGLYLSRATS